jgi:hypothetical protein
MGLGKRNGNFRFVGNSKVILRPIPISIAELPAKRGFRQHPKTKGPQANPPKDFTAFPEGSKNEALSCSFHWLYSPRILFSDFQPKNRMSSPETT